MVWYLDKIVQICDYTQLTNMGLLLPLLICLLDYTTCISNVNADCTESTRFYTRWHERVDNVIALSDLVLQFKASSPLNAVPLSVQQEQQTSVARTSATASTETRFDADTRVQILQHDPTLKFTQLCMVPAGITLHISHVTTHTSTHTCRHRLLNRQTYTGSSC